MWIARYILEVPKLTLMLDALSDVGEFCHCENVVLNVAGLPVDRGSPRLLEWCFPSIQNPFQVTGMVLVRTQTTGS